MSEETTKATRFFVDERGGCIAVRDRTLTDPEYQGLHEDTEGVVWFGMGERKEVVCPTCGQHRGIDWSVSDSLKAEAARVCEEHNAASR